jgi:hypothetical protein
MNTNARLEHLVGGLADVSGVIKPVEINPIPEVIDDKKGYAIYTFNFTDPATSEQCEGAVFVLNPGGTTTAMQLTKAGYKERRQVASGSGHMVLRNPHGTVRTQVLDATNAATYRPIDIGEGWTDQIFAGPDGLVVLAICSPPFKPEFEREVAPFSPIKP